MVIDELKTLLERNHAAGLFTHVAASTGMFEEASASELDVFLSSETSFSQQNPDVFDLSSMTKALVTTPLCLKKAWSKGLDETATLGQVFSAHSFFELPSAKDLRLCDVLRHESGLPAWRNFYVACGRRPNKYETLNQALIERRVPQANVYSDVGMILLGTLLEDSYGKPLTDVFEDFCQDDLMFFSSEEHPRAGFEFAEDRCISTGFCEVRQRTLKGEVHDENAWALGGFPGHSGLFGSLMQVKNYLKAFYNSRVGFRVLAVNNSWSERHPTSDSALGFRTGRDPSSMPFGFGHSIGHMGFTGTAFWIDWSKRRYAILLTNRVAMARTTNMKGIKQFRSEVFSLLQKFHEARL